MYLMVAATLQPAWLHPGCRAGGAASDHCHGPAILRASHASAHCEWSRLGWSSRFGPPHPFGLSHGAAQALLHRLLPALLRCPSASILSRQPAPAQDLELREHAQHEQRQVPLLLPATDAAAAATCSTRRTCCSGAARWAPSGKCWAGGVGRDTFENPACACPALTARKRAAHVAPARGADVG